MADTAARHTQRWAAEPMRHVPDSSVLSTRSEVVDGMPGSASRRVRPIADRVPPPRASIGSDSTRMLSAEIDGDQTTTTQTMRI